MELWNSNEVKKLKEHVEEYLVTEEKCAKDDTDKDRCSFVWENLYIKYYKSRVFWKGTNFDGYKKAYNISYKNLVIRISGDVLFNFKSKKDGIKGNLKYEHYEALIKEKPDFDEKQKVYYVEILNFCNKMNYTLHNFGFMPVDGNLQIFKERYCDWDRMDRFVYFVAEYFNGNDKFVLTSNYRDKEKREKKENEDRKNLNKFFSVFNKSKYKYCEEMYLITDNEYVKDLVEFGEKEIKRGKDVVRYMELAIKYWIIKDKMFYQFHNKDGGDSN